jgi:putative transposase
MSSLITAALAYLASWFQSRHAMQLEILALRHQLAVYQKSVKRPQLQPADRCFWAWFSRLWSGWQHTLEFVHPRTVLAWQKQRFRDYWRRLSQRGKPGRPTISKAVRDLIQDMWCSNPTWGSPRIVGELRKLGITVAKSTVEKYRPRDRKPPSPTWKAFLSNHVKDIVACDFFTVPTVQCRVLFVFIMLAHDRRRIMHFNVTEHPVVSLQRADN